jgi:uncharacterized DUF497 family protein
MDVTELAWDEENEANIARHRVTPDEVEEVCFSRHWMFRARGRKRRALFGQTAAGRYLMVIVEVLDYGECCPITARDMNQMEGRRFRAWKGQR